MSQKRQLHGDVTVHLGKQEQNDEIQRLLALLRLSSPTQIDALGRIKFGEFSYPTPSPLGIKITNKVGD